jgi:radical SAM superfamily enzyme YgiQ (UPF0313 family)
MVALPTETVEDFKASQELLERLDQPPFMYNHFVPYPGTTLFDYCINNGLIQVPQILGDWGQFTVRLATEVNLSQVPSHIIEKATLNFKRTYATRRLRFTIRHNPTYFLKIFSNPIGFFNELKSLFKHYLMMSSDSRNPKTKGIKSTP